MTLRITDLDPVGEPRRGLRRCPGCEDDTLRLRETFARPVTAFRGAVVCTRRYRCDSCGVTVRFLEVSVGIVAKRSERPWPRDRSEASTENASDVTVSAGRIVIRA